MAEMSSRLGGSLSWRTLAALVWMFAVFWVLGVGGLLGFESVSMRLAKGVRFA